MFQSWERMLNKRVTNSAKGERTNFGWEVGDVSITACLSDGAMTDDLSWSEDFHLPPRLQKSPALL